MPSTLVAEQLSFSPEMPQHPLLDTESFEAMENAIGTPEFWAAMQGPEGTAVEPQAIAVVEELADGVKVGELTAKDVDDEFSELVEDLTGNLEFPPIENIGKLGQVLDWGFGKHYKKN